MTTVGRRSQAEQPLDELPPVDGVGRPVRALEVDQRHVLADRAVADEVEDVDTLVQRLQHGRQRRLAPAELLHRRERRERRGRPLELGLDVDGSEPRPARRVALDVARPRHHRERAEVVPREHRDRPPVRAAEVARQQHAGQRRDRGAAGRVAQRLPAHGVEVRRRVDVKAHVERELAARGDRQRLLVEGADVRGPEHHLRQRLAVGRLVVPQQAQRCEVECERLLRLVPALGVRAGQVEAEVRVEAVAGAIPAEPELEIGVSRHERGPSPTEPGA